MTRRFSFKRLLRRSFLSVAIIIIACVQTLPAAAFSVVVKDDKGAPVPNVAVALFPHNAQAAKAGGGWQVKQEEKLFDPFLTVVHKGAKVSFPNKDRTRHHVYSFSKAKRFNLPLFLGNSKDVEFDQEGVVSLGCNIHDWMLAYVVVADTPFYGKTDSSGTADLGKAPDGTYTLKYWYPGMKNTSAMTELDNAVQAAQGRYSITIPAGSLQTQPEKPANAPNDYE